MSENSPQDSRPLGLADAHGPDGREQFGRAPDGCPRGTVFWNETAGRFIDVPAAHQAVRDNGKAKGLLNMDVLNRLREFVVEHLSESIDVATLAKLANRSQFHFARAFTRSVGMSPHRYVVHLRLQRAVEMIRDGKFCLAQVAARTGFADQSHLTRWVRRVYGVSPTQIRPNDESDRRNLQERPATSLLD